MPEGKGKEAYGADRNLFPMLISFLEDIKHFGVSGTPNLYTT